MTPEDQTSTLIPRSTADINGFCHNYPLRRHNFEHKANEGSFQCRKDWVRYIGPIGRWGSCNPWEGHFGAVVLPFCRPERLAVICYIFEYAFLYDNVVESAAQSTLSDYGDTITLDETEYRTVRSITGTKQIQSKMLLDLLSIDAPCAQVVIDSWKTMIGTTAHRDKSRPFESLEEYVEYRIVDTGAPFVAMLMRFGMGILLTREENALIDPIVHPNYAALGLANDYFSFDVEWEEYQQEKATGQDPKPMTNLVWLFMHWRGVDIPEAKRLTRETVNGYEREFLERMEVFCIGEGKDNSRLREYLKGQMQQVSGNIAWSLRCPRYHPELCEKGAALLHGKSARGAPPPSPQRQPVLADEHIHNHDNASHSLSVSEASSDEVSMWSAPSPRSSVSSASGHDHEHEHEHTNKHTVKQTVALGNEHLVAPAEYVTSLPSKGVREAFIDALNVWMALPDHLVNKLKRIAQTLHNTSLMLDDIEDSSPLRRGLPATHTIFGPAITINSANWTLLHVAEQVRQLDNDINTNNTANGSSEGEGVSCIDIFMEEMLNLFIGQSFDLHWTFHGTCPTEEEYLEMVNQKTGGLFRLTARLMARTASIHQNKRITLSPLLTTLGQYFQIRDDYKNLTPEYAAAKGLAEDLDEGKFSFPLVHALTTSSSRSRVQDQIRGILRHSRHSETPLDPVLKTHFVELLRQSGSLGYTEEVLGRLMGGIESGISVVEMETGTANWVLRLLVRRLKV